jgi:quercetin dioxygenase-like cupin family protein
MVIRGRVTFRIGDEERILGPGGTWRILSDVPHSVVTGPDGAEVIDVFSPARLDWDDKPPSDSAVPRWP